MGDMAPVLAIASLVFGAVWIVVVISNNIRRSKIATAQQEMQAKLFDRFGTSQDVLAYLNSEAGSRFLDSAAVEHARPFGRVLGSIQAGLILFFIGIAMLIVRSTMPAGASHELLVARTNLASISLLLLGLGIGFLASAAASYTLSKKWGLFDRQLNRQV